MSSIELIEIAAGNVPGYSTMQKFGHNDDIDTGTVPETIWTQGGLWVPPTAARTHQITSTDVADDYNTPSSGGTGARTLRIWGLDANFVEQTEDINLNGTANVATANTYTRIFRMMVLTAGSNKKNVGDITATADHGRNDHRCN